MKRAALILFAIGLQIMAFAAGPKPQKVQVVDAFTGEELTAVCVKIEGFSEVLYTDEHGYVDFPQIDSESAVIHFSVVSYKTCSLNSQEFYTTATDGVVRMMPR